MLDDLLDAPLAGICRGPELGLGGIERVESGCYFSLEGLENGIHRDGTKLHRPAVRRTGFCCFILLSYLLSSARDFLASLAFSPLGSSLR